MCLVALMAVADGCHCEEDQCQHGEDQRLNHTDKDFQRIERQRQEEGNQEGHRCQHDFTGKDIAKETKAKGEDAGELGNNFQEAHKDGDPLHSDVITAGIGELAEISATLCAHTPNLHHQHGRNSQRKGHIEVGTWRTEERYELFA